MFEGDSADTCARKFPLLSIGGRAEGLACADPVVRTPIGASGNLNRLQRLAAEAIRFAAEALRKASEAIRIIYLV